MVATSPPTARLLAVVDSIQGRTRYRSAAASGSVYSLQGLRLTYNPAGTRQNPNRVFESGSIAPVWLAPRPDTPILPVLPFASTLREDTRCALLGGATVGNKNLNKLKR